MTTRRRSFLLLVVSLLLGVGLGIAARTWKNSRRKPVADAHERKKPPKHPRPVAAAATTEQLAAKFDKLLAQVRSAENAGADPRGELRTLLRAWLQTDPVGCLNHLYRRDATGLLDAKLITATIARRPGSSLRNFIATAQKLEDRDLAEGLFREAFRLNLHDSTEDPLEMLAIMPAHLQQSLSYEAALYVAKIRGVDQLRTFLKKYPDAKVNALETLARVDPTGAITLFDELYSKTDLETINPFAVPFVASAGRRKAPELVLAWLKTFPPSANRDSELAEVSAVLLQKQPERLEELRGLFVSDEGRKVFAEKAGAENASQHPQLAADLIRELPTAGDRIEAYEHAAQKMRAPADAIDWLLNVATPFDRAKAVDWIHSGWLMNAPTEAVAYSLDHMDDVAVRDSMVRNISGRLPANDGPVAKETLKMLDGLSPAARAKLKSDVAPLLPPQKGARLVELLR